MRLSAKGKLADEYRAGEGIHWPDLDEDISVENVWAGRSSGESQRSLKLWLEARNKGNNSRMCGDT